MKLIATKDAVGHVLCHDITQIIKDVKKDAVFRKGHIVEEKDIPILLSVGKEHLYVWEKKEGMLHEDEAAEILRQICMGQNMHATLPKEGKIELIADCDGLFKINSAQLLSVNSLGEMIIATRKGNTYVRKGTKLAGMRVIPLVIEEEKMSRAKSSAADQPILNVLPIEPIPVGIVTTGSEVYHHRIEDTFTPVVVQKVEEMGAYVCGHVICDDQHEEITKAIWKLIEAGAKMVICTGGMSVDPDDRTPLAIRQAGVNIVTYGAPVLPGAMFMLGYTPEGIPVIGLPGCVMYAKRTIFDKVLPRLLAKEILRTEDFYQYGEGGLCLNCKECRFPDCSFS